MIEVSRGLAEVRPQVFAIGVLSLGVVLWFAARSSRLPGALLAIVGATLIVEVFDPVFAAVPVLGSLPAGLPPISLPEISAGDAVALLPASAAIAVIAAADTIVSSRAFAQRNHYEVDANRDLVGLGAANVASGISGGITTSASAARTAVVEMVGGRSQIAGVTAAMLMATVLLFLTRPLERVPMPALAAVVIAAVVRLIEIGSLRGLWRIRRTEFAIAMATSVGAVTLGLLQGIAVGIGLSVVDHLVRVLRLRRASRRARVVGHAGDGRSTIGAGVSVDEILYRFEGTLYFANAHRFKEGARRSLKEQPLAQRLIIDASCITDIDTTGVQMLAGLADDLAGGGITLEIIGPPPQVRAVLDGAGQLNVAPDEGGGMEPWDRRTRTRPRSGETSSVWTDRKVPNTRSVSPRNGR